MVESLLCEATTCIHNASKQCTAPSINIVGGPTRTGSDTFCGSFSEDENLILPDTTNFVMGVASRGDQYTADRLTEFNGAPAIECNAVKCTYNDSNICYATGIKILGQEGTAKGSTECDTFRPE